MLLNRRCRALVQLPRLRRNCIAFKSRAFVRNRSLSCVSLNISMNIYLSRGVRSQPLALVCISPYLSEYLPLAFVLPSLSTLAQCPTQATIPYDGIFQDSHSQLRAAEDQKVVRRNMHHAHVKNTRMAFCLHCPGPVWGGCSACVKVDDIGSVLCSPCKLEELLPEEEVPV